MLSRHGGCAEHKQHTFLIHAGCCRNFTWENSNKHLGRTKSRPYTISHSVMYAYCCYACVAGFLAELCFADLCFAAARCRFFCAGCQGLRSFKFYQ